MNRLQAYESIAPVLTERLSGDRAAAIQPVIKAAVLKDAAWDIRGTGYTARRYRMKSIRRFEELLTQAEASLCRWHRQGLGGIRQSEAT